MTVFSRNSDEESEGETKCRLPLLRSLLMPCMKQKAIRISKSFLMC